MGSNDVAAVTDPIAESEALAEIARGLAGAANDLGASFDLLATGAVTLLAAAGAIVAQIEGDVFHVSAAAGSLVPMIGFRAPLADSFAAAVMGRGHAVTLNDAASDPRLERLFLAAFDPRQLVVAPMMAEREGRGFVLALNSGRGAFTVGDGLTLQRIADYGAIALRHGELIKQVRDGAQQARERERALADTMHQTEKLAALGELVAGVAHELNNPLTGISMFAQLLLDDALDEDQRESVRTIKREADRAVGVIRDLLAFSRKSGPRMVAVDLNALINQTLRLRAYSLQTAGVQVTATLDPALPAIAGDDRKLQQVLLNLIVNAEYAMHRQGTRELTVRTMWEGGAGSGRTIVEITDTGTGMAPELVKHIFEPFFTTKPAGVGTGLGLSVSYGIVQAHGGTITVRSAPGTGSTFVISLPLRTQHLPVPAATGRRSRSAPSPTAAEPAVSTLVAAPSPSSSVPDAD
jgi:signal transduction histidine kinase